MKNLINITQIDHNNQVLTLQEKTLSLIMKQVQMRLKLIRQQIRMKLVIRMKQEIAIQQIRMVIQPKTKLIQIIKQI